MLQLLLLLLLANEVATVDDGVCVCDCAGVVVVAETEAVVGKVNNPLDADVAKVLAAVVVFVATIVEFIWFCCKSVWNNVVLVVFVVAFVELLLLLVDDDNNVVGDVEVFANGRK